jgi:class 3 adenylate cyclase
VSLALARRDLLALVLIALGIPALLALPAFDRLRGLSIDWLTALSFSLGASRPEPGKSPAVVIALDEETYRHKPFEGTPSVTWTNEIGKVLAAVVDSGAKVVGFDIIFPTSLEESEIPFDGGTLGAKVRGLDRDYLRTLARAARDGKLVLGQVQHQDRPILPSAAQRIAVGHQRNIRLLNLHTDADDVVRRVPFAFDVGGTRLPSMSVELAARLLAKPAELMSDGGLSLGGWRVPQRVPGTFALNFAGGGDEIPTYSLADLRHCVDKGDAAFFAKHFAGRAVLVGTLLDLEDRKLTSKRLATGLEGALAERCALPAQKTGGRVERDSIAGVYVHAVAVGNLVRRDVLREPSRLASWLVTALVALAAGAAALRASLPAAVLLVAVLAATWTVAAVLARGSAFVLPFIDALVSGALTVFAVIAYRFAVTDKDKRLLRRTFSLYLAPTLVERMLDSSTPPKLGGETRVVTIFRSDLAGFSTLSEHMAPDALVAMMNEYLSAMTDIIGAHGGFVDKYIGDAIDAVFGAPVDDPDHAYHAVQAALACQKKLADMNAAKLPAFGGLELAQRIGLHTGPGLVGNIGSRQRFNYTVMGDTANVASRIEGANKFYGTAIMASAATAEAAGDRILWRELDLVRVVGREEPLGVLEPLGLAAEATAEQRALAAGYAEGLSRWRSRDFAGAAAIFGAAAGRDPASASMHERALDFAGHPPGIGWQPVNALETK